MIGSIIGSYRVERELGEGGMSHVYVGRTTTATSVLPADYQVVLKVMSDELANEQTARKRFVKEAEILSKLRHRYITRFFEFLPRETGAVLVMEFVDGHPVDALIGERGALQIQEAIMVTQCLLDALVYAHGKNIVHRDIKPANLIKQKSGGGVKVTDFGIAKMRDAASTGTGATVLTRSGFLLGTPHYMSPEQIREPKDAGAKSDVYSTGVVLYEMLTGVLPFNSRSLPKLIEAVYKGDKQPPSTLRPEIHRDLDGIVMKAMHPDQNQRYATAREFYEALEEFNSHPDMIGRIIAPPVAPVAPIANDETSIRGGDVPLAYELVAVKSESGEKHKVQGDTVMIGRDRSCAIVLNHPAVSRRHARITFSDGAVVVEDLKSANGTYVNNTRVERASLKPGDVVRFGADPSCSYVVKSRAADAR